MSSSTDNTIAKLRKPSLGENSMIDDDELVKAWYGPETNDEIAKRFGVRPRAIIIEWRRLRSEGKIPRGVMRESAMDYDGDDRKTTKRNVMDDLVKASRQFLDRLREAHGNRNGELKLR